MPYRANQIPLGKRIFSGFLAVLLLAWGTVGVLRDDLLYPGAWESKLHFKGPSAWLMYAAMTCAALVLLSIVLDHYDRRDNERDYRIFAQRFQNWGWLLFGAAIIAHVLMAIYSAI